jgi:hypothetical protein
MLVVFGRTVEEDSVIHCVRGREKVKANLEDRAGVVDVTDGPTTSVSSLGLENINKPSEPIPKMPRAVAANPLHHRIFS